MAEGSDLDLSEEEDHQVGDREGALLCILFETNGLSQHHIQCMPRLLAASASNPLTLALTCWHIEDLRGLSLVLSLIGGAQEDGSLIDDEDCDHDKVVLSEEAEHRDILSIECLDMSH